MNFKILRNKLSLTGFSLFLLLFVFVPSAWSQICQTPDPGTPSWRFPGNTRVAYYFDYTITDGDQKNQIRQAIAHWEDANFNSNCSRIGYIEGLPEGPPPGTEWRPTITFTNGSIASGAAASMLPVTYTSATLTMQDALITFNVNLMVGGIRVYDPAKPGYDTMFKKIAMHEIGHAQGLTHYYNGHNPPCATQTRGAAVMNDGCGVNDVNNNIAQFPTNCDNARFTYFTCPSPSPTPTPTCTTTYEADYFSHCYDGEDNDCDGASGMDDLDCRCVMGGSGFDGDYDGYCDDIDCDPWDPRYPAQGCPYSPIVVDVAGNGFDLTNAASGVDFNIDGSGAAEHLSWTSANSDDAWLALDRNGNGLIENGQELFGNFTPQPIPAQGTKKNGFIALAEYDKAEQGGNSDGIINANDAIFSQLRLRQDANHNGISEQSELKTLTQLGLAEIELLYRESRRTDQHGNQFKYRAKVKDVHGQQVGRWAWDVFLIRAGGSNSAKFSISEKFNINQISLYLGFAKLFGNNSSKCNVK